MTKIEDLEYAKKVAGDLMELMKVNLENDGHLSPVAFLFGARDPATGAQLDRPRPVVVALDMRSPQAKKESTARLRDLARQADAIFVLTGAECSTVMCNDKGLAVSRMEAVVVNLEHRSGCCTWLGRITRAGTGRARIAKFEELDAVPMAGDFGDFLPRKAQPSSLH